MAGIYLGISLLTIPQPVHIYKCIYINVSITFLEVFIGGFISSFYLDSCYLENLVSHCGEEAMSWGDWLFPGVVQHEAAWFQIGFLTCGGNLLAFLLNFYWISNFVEENFTRPISVLGLSTADTALTQKSCLEDKIRSKTVFQLHACWSSSDSKDRDGNEKAPITCWSPTTPKISRPFNGPLARLPKFEEDAWIWEKIQ